MSRIKKLDDSVINRIAAGEVVQRPANGLKEMIENSIDADSTSIQVVVNAGGLKLLQIQDNGHGINREDLPIVCERFTTSKLSTFEDLSSISTFGFRGEALASLSHVAYVSITTRTKDSQCAYRARYCEGKLFAKAGESSVPKPCAGNAGTVISIEDLFYSMPLRRKALTNPTEEFNRICEVVTKYSIHNQDIAMSLKKQGSTSLEVNSPASATRRDRIRSAYGAGIDRELLEVEGERQDLQMKFQGLVTNPNFSGKKLTFILFINNRLVDCNQLKHALENLYAQYIPKHTHPFLYLSLSLAPHNVDVNVHPTKHEVRFLHEDAIVGFVERAVDKVLLTANTSRNFSIQQSLTASHVNASEILKSKAQDKPTDKTYDYNLIRTDPKSQKLDLFFPQSTQNQNQDQPEQNSTVEPGMSEYIEKVQTNATDSEVITLSSQPEIPVTSLSDQPEPVSIITVSSQSQPSLSAVESMEVCDSNTETLQSQSSEELEVCPLSVEDSEVEIVSKSKRPRISSSPPRPSPAVTNRREHSRQVELTSILTLREKFTNKSHPTLQRLFQQHSFVGIVDATRVLVQYDTGLYLLDLAPITQELFYQLFLLDFANFSCLRLSTPLSIYELAMIGLDSPSSGWKEEDSCKDKESLANYIVGVFKSQSRMLSDYFSLEVDPDGNLCTLPMLLDGYVPNLNQLPFFVMRFVTEVDWESEMDCFELAAREISRFYAVRENDTVQPECTGANEKDRSVRTRAIEHVIMPSLRKEFLPPESLLKEGTVLQIADLHELYKVFERC